MDVYVARQPIFDENLNVYAYELFFRSNKQTNSYTNEDHDYASMHTAMESFYSIGIDTISGKKPAFINFTPMLLLENFATLFSKELIVIEILENIEPTKEIVEACRKLHKMGYILAMDDFVYQPKYEPLAKLCKIIKIDFLSNKPEDISYMLEDMSMDIDLKDKLFLAEKIETLETFNRAVGMGFKLFQGYFFSKPVTMSGKHLMPLATNYLSLIAEINTEDEMDFGRIANIVRSDVALCHKLLRMVNTSYYSLSFEVTDIRQALTHLGTKEIRKWIYFSSLVELCADKPDELIRMSLIRAFFIEKIGEACQLDRTNETMFLLGMFSLIDVIMRQPMKTALAGLNLEPYILEALMERKGKMYNLLLLVGSIETASWNETDLLAALLGINVKYVSKTYIEAVKLCDKMLNDKDI